MMYMLELPREKSYFKGGLTLAYSGLNNLSSTPKDANRVERLKEIFWIAQFFVTNDLPHPNLTQILYIQSLYQKGSSIMAAKSG